MFAYIIIMVMKLKIKSIKKTGMKYKIILDNDEIITTNDQVIINHNLLYKPKLTQKLLNKIKEDTNYYDNYNKILKMINRKIRSEHEIRETLKKNEVSKNDIDQIVTTLKNIGLLNDAEFATAYTNDRINLSLDGPYKIKKDLENNHIDDIYINNALEKFDQPLIDQRLEKIIIKKMKNNTKDTDYIFKQKTSLYLLNLGYSKEDINNHLLNIKIDNSHLEKEMEKIYNKLKNKYDGYILKNKLKQKLFSKGFTSEEINEFIEKTVR